MMIRDRRARCLLDCWGEGRLRRIIWLLRKTWGNGDCEGEVANDRYDRFTVEWAEIYKTLKVIGGSF